MLTTNTTTLQLLIPLSSGRFFSPIKSRGRLHSTDTDGRNSTVAKVSTNRGRKVDVVPGTEVVTQTTIRCVRSSLGMSVG